MLYSILSLVLLSFLFSFSLASASDPSTPVFTSPAGPIQGVQRHNSFNFLGIPYAIPPTGERRYTAPQPYPAFNQTYIASQWGPGCVQKCLLPDFACPAAQSEDCLTLNIYAPANLQPNSNLSTLVFFHGGNFRSGGGGCPLYDASLWVSRENIIVVTANYRLGAFGFFVNAAVPANLGLLDQQLVLRWLHANIGSFGGNPSAVTLVGQSAGGTSVDAHLQNPESLALISGAIVESVPGGIPLRSWPEFTSMQQAFAKFAGCQPDDIKCFQSLTSEQILNAQLKAARNPLNSDHPLFEFFQSWEPLHWTVGEPFPQPSGPSFPIPNSGFFFYDNLPTNFPVMYGTVSQEAFVFVYEIFEKNVSKFEAEAALAVFFGLPHVGPLMNNYPIYPEDGTDHRAALSRLITDYMYTCPNRNFTRSIARMRGAMSHSQVDNSMSYRYFFSELAAEGKAGWGPNFTICWTHVCHAAELAFVFNSAWAIGQTLQPQEQALANLMGTYWANFAKSGNPNIPTSVPQWDSVSAESTTVMQFNDQQTGMIKDPRGALCDLWDSIGYAY